MTYESFLIGMMKTPDERGSTMAHVWSSRCEHCGARDNFLVIDFREGEHG